MSRTIEQLEVRNTAAGIKHFADSLTDVVVDLAEKEKGHLITHDMATKALSGMIESFVYTVIQLEIRKREAAESPMSSQNIKRSISSSHENDQLLEVIGDSING